MINGSSLPRCPVVGSPGILHLSLTEISWGELKKKPGGLLIRQNGDVDDNHQTVAVGDHRHHKTDV